MNSAFTFDRDTHATLADVTASQLSSSNGYTQDDKTLANVSVTEDDTVDAAKITWDDFSWTAVTGNLGGAATGSLILYDDTTSDDTVIVCLDYDADHTIAAGETLTLEGPEVLIEGTT